MNKYILIIVSAFLLFSCSDEDYAELNTDLVNPQDVSEDALFNGATISLFDQMESTNVNRNVFRLLSQYWTETTYIDEANYDLNNRNVPGNHWTILYDHVLFSLNDSKKKVLANAALSEEEKIGRVAQITILEVYTWQILVDTFGDIPYSEALLDRENPTPAYDDAEEIYMDLFNKLDQVIPTLGGSIGFPDVNYYGNMDLWAKFANSLKLKLAIRMADYNPSLAMTKVSEAYNAGVFTSNADNFIIRYEGANPNTNPLWNDLVESGRSDFVVANTFVDYLNALDDPRRKVFFDDNIDSGYVGGIYGDNNSFSEYTHIGTVFHEPTLRGVLMDYSEVSFYLAEAAARGWSVGNTVQDYYENGISANFESWGLTEQELQDYLNDDNVDYNMASGDWKEKIGFQMWIAMYNRGFEGWTTWRRLGSPELNLPADSGLPVPLRYTYPQDEQTLNKTNYEAASAAIGGDTQQTPIFWDVN
ncbi:SusD/RagB family nutrient-binding outer membrane lipoprotein [Flavobacteriaceae bacterium Ap0902]|nr:SusD/RagB family nutrient-binding outer membrane lipoprotein [Flavobacteriaceae bacterium Ap0902]